MSGKLPVQKGVLQSSPNYTWNCADAVGRGATAVVYLGRHKRTGQVVAIKLFHQYLRYSQCREDLPELEILRRLKHDNIIKVLGIEQEVQSKRTVLVMEYCEGGSVLSMLDQPQYCYGLPEIQCLLLLQHVAAGMQYLRQAGVVHRDIKPANIMRAVTEDGSSVYKLTDFGAARQLNEGENFTSMYGTEEYLHPEMYEKGVLRHPTEQRFDARTDLWSLGVTFYHVATGQLPFKPYGGRNNRETMHRIISQKERGVISGQQHFDGGPIHWSRHLPPTCLLSSGFRQFLTPMLADLMEADLSRVLSYEAFFACVRSLESLVPLTVFDYLHAARHTLLLSPSTTLSGVQEALAPLTELPASQQLLLEGGHALGDVLDPPTPLSAFPAYLRHSATTTIYLFPRQSALPSRPPPLPSPHIPPFPEFLDVVDIDKDVSLAQHCLARGQLIKQHADTIRTQQDCLIQGHLHLRMYAEARLRAVGESLQLIQQLVRESRKRFSTFYSSTRSLQEMLTALGHPPDAFLRDVLQDDTLLRVQQKAEERAEEIVQYKQGLQDRLSDTRPHTLQWAQCCQHTSCLSKVEHQLAVMSVIQSKFRRDKSVKDSLTSHDESIHRLERQKLQETCTRLLSVLTGHCVPAREHLRKQAFDFTSSLIRTLARISKVEKNNESVINCQQLLSARLDKIEKKCQDEVAHLKDQLAQLTRGQLPQVHSAKLTAQQTFSEDEGLGTLGSQSASRYSSPSLPHSSERQEAALMETAVGGSLDLVSVRNSLQSLRLESEEVLCLITENMDIMQRLEAQEIQTGSLSLSTVLETLELT